jgi:hypothetical protein
MADQILSTQMGLMESGDSYDVISDITSWRDNPLEDFRRESVKALIKRVKVRRVFSRFRLDLPSPSDPSYTERCKKTIKTLEEHLQYSKQYPGYEVKVLGENELKKLLDIGTGNSILTRDKIEKAHFGLFKQGAAPKTVIRFMVKLSDLSDMELCRKASVVEDDVKLFRSVWLVSADLTKGLIQKLEKELIPEVKQ